MARKQNKKASGFISKIKKVLKDENRSKLIIVIVLVGLVLTQGAVRLMPRESLSYSDFMTKVEQQEVQQIKLNLREGKKMVVTLKDDQVFETDNPKSENFKLEMLEAGVEVVETSNSWLSSLVSLFSLGLTAALIFVMSKNISGGSKNSKPISERPEIDFSHIGGLDEIKDELSLLVEFLKSPAQFKEQGAELPKGVILYGNPGTGKTLLAKAIAGEAHVPFFSVSGSDFIELFAGMGARRVRTLFEEGRKVAPCIIFIDEIDAIGSKRTSNVGNGEGRQTINALLEAMDGFKSIEGIMVICATNRIEDLDAALIRPGRFDKHICVPLPQTTEERLAILDIYKKGKRFADDVDFQTLAKDLIGTSPADIKVLLNEAALISIMQKKEMIDQACLDEAIYKKLLKGHVKKNHERDQFEMELVAWHEAGHAVLAKLFNLNVSRVTITPSTSGSGGVNIVIPKKSNLYSIEELENQVKVRYGGRLAELMYTQDDSQVTTGAQNDIEMATSLIRDMILKYGMSKKYGLIDLTQFNLDEETLLGSSIVVSKRLEEQALQLLETHRVFLETVVVVLLEEETINGLKLDELYRAYLKSC